MHGLLQRQVLVFSFQYRIHVSRRLDFNVLEEELEDLSHAPHLSNILLLSLGTFSARLLGCRLSSGQGRYLRRRSRWSRHHCQPGKHLTEVVETGRAKSDRRREDGRTGCKVKFLIFLNACIVHVVHRSFLWSFEWNCYGFSASPFPPGSRPKLGSSSATCRVSQKSAGWDRDFFKGKSGTTGPAWPSCQRS
jgi:hypothetical protein